MSDPKWKDYLNPVIDKAVSALASIISGQLIDKLLAKRLLTTEQHEKAILNLRTDLPEDVARNLFFKLRMHPPESFSEFCSVVKEWEMGRCLYSLLKAETNDRSPRQTLFGTIERGDSGKVRECAKTEAKLTGEWKSDEGFTPSSIARDTRRAHPHGERTRHREWPDEVPASVGIADLSLQKPKAIENFQSHEVPSEVLQTVQFAKSRAKKSEGQRHMTYHHESPDEVSENLGLTDSSLQKPRESQADETMDSADFSKKTPEESQSQKQDQDTAGKSDGGQLQAWLENLGLKQYYKKFCSNGFEDLSDLENIEEKELALIGVLRGHRRKILGRLRKDFPPQIQRGDENLLVKMWLADLRLETYYDKFLKEGFEDMESLNQVEDQDLDYMEVLMGHKKRIRKKLSLQDDKPRAHVVAEASYCGKTKDGLSFIKEDAVVILDGRCFSNGREGAFPNAALHHSIREEETSALSMSESEVLRSAECDQNEGEKCSKSAVEQATLTKSSSLTQSDLESSKAARKALGDSDTAPEEVVDMSLPEAMQRCFRLGIDCEEEGLETASQCKERLLHILKENGVRGKSQSVLKFAARSIEVFKKKRAEFENLIDTIRCFVNSQDIIPYLLDLGILETRAWMSDADFQAGKESCTSGKPMILVAGPTSSGKSTLVNALLGRSVLPTSHNATTSTLCEIKQGAEKKAVMHLETRAGAAGDVQITHSEQLLDMESEREREAFVSLVNPDRGELAGTTATSCNRAEVYWPSQFLQEFTLIDSPGVTENDDLSPASRQITEQCQRDTACCFIYVIDATQSAEVGAQVGGLLAAMARGTKTSPSADSALFVLNKWDQFLEEYGREESERASKEYLERLCFELGRRWRGFKWYQVIKMNSKLAGLAQELGVLTNDMKNLCEGISDVLPRGINNLILKGLKRPIDLLDYIEQSIEATLREFKLPEDQRTRKRNENTKRLVEFQESLSSGKMAKLRRQIDERLDDLTHEVAEHLKTKEKIAEALDCDAMSTDTKNLLFNDREVKELVDHRLAKMICDDSRVDEVKHAIDKQLGPHVEEELHRLVSFSSEIFTAKPSLSRRSDDDRRAFDMSAYLFSSLLVGFIAATAFAVAPILAVPMTGIYGIVKLVQFMQKPSFREVVEKAYKEAVNEVCIGSKGQLRERVKRKIVLTSLTARIVYEDFERKVKELDDELSARNKRRRKDLPKYKRLLSQSQRIIGTASTFMLGLGIEDYVEGDIVWPNPCIPVDSGVFGEVFKVGLARRKEVVLKIPKDPISEENAEEFLRELVISRNLTGKDSYVVEFYGLVRVQRSPLKLALAFEWCSGGNLADEMFGPSSQFVPGRKSGGYLHARHILLQLFSGVMFLHGENLVHRDIKPENILLTADKEVRIADLGLAKDLEEITGTQCGTILYMAPEVMIKYAYGTSADIFSVGIIMWELWHGERAYVNSGDPSRSLGHPAKFAMKVFADNFRPPGFVAAEYSGQGADPNDASVDWRSLMRRCWDSSASSRPTAKEARSIVDKMPH